MVRKSTIAAIRFGHGFRPGETPPDGPEALVTALRDGGGAGPAPDDAAMRLALQNEFLDAREDAGRRKELARMTRLRGLADIARRIERRALSPHGFHERMAAFWADHFTIAASNLRQSYYLGAYEDESIRPHMTGRFADMLKAVVRAPAMLFYLDQVASIGPNSKAGRRGGRGLNENLAREALELHTLGVGGPYSQGDVREFAELLTGFGAARREMAFRFARNRAEPGAETVLGRTYGGDPAEADDVDALLEDLARHPATARHLARKLAIHFVADEPDPDLVAHVAAAWEAGGGDLVRVATALVEHPAAWREPGRKVRQPVDLIAATLRATGADAWIEGDDAATRGRRMLVALRAMGQQIFKPPGPDGWPEEAEAWITPQGLAGRLQFAGTVGRALAARPGPDPRAFAGQALGEMLGEATRFVVGAAPDRWEGYALTIASPEFNRR